ncbi:MAG: fatty acid--CoA ligase family protein, partial [Gammaproteobacteria bacterium]|nr:fatty acid--CoA ligase family protein [Gammaproteobacteria bacterium]
AAFDVRAVLGEPGGGILPGPDCLIVDQRWCAAAAAAAPGRVEISSLQPLLLNVSSGTTGEPRAAVVTHADFDARLARQAEIHGDLEGHRYLSVAPLCFGGGLMFLLYHLASGNSVVLYPPLYAPAELLGLLREQAITHTFLVPTALRWLLQAARSGGAPLLPDLAVLLTSAAPMAAAEKRAVRERVCPNFFEYYATSAVGTVAVLRPHEVEEHATSVGRPLPSLECGVVDENGQDVDAGETGRLRCRGAGVSGEFIGAPGNSGQAERIAGGWCYTGDIGWLDREGFLHLAGRADEMIIRGGVNVQPESVEKVLREHPAITEVAVVGRAAPELGQHIVAYVQAQGALTAAELLAHCRARLPGHMVPERIEFLDEFPRSAAGKIRRRELP